MPVDAAQPLKTEHAAGTPGECLVVEYLLVECQQRLASLLELCTVRLHQRIQLCIEIAHIVEIRIKTIAPVGIADDDVVLPLFQQTFEQGYRRYRFCGYQVLFQKTGQSTIRIQHEALLIVPINITLEQGFEHLDSPGRRYSAGAECGHLTFEHGIKGADSDGFRLDVQQVIGMVQAIFAHVALDAVVNDGEGIGQHGGDLVQWLACFSGE